MRIKLKSLKIENFKGIKEKSIDFTDKTEIKGANAVGKTTIFDSFMWGLFNKNSVGEEKFNVRPLDAEGNRIDNVEIKVMVTLEVDGKEVVLSKVQKQNWVKKRGTDAAVLQGNVNSFEIDGYPKSEAEYKAYISSLVEEDLFKMLTNPQYFVNMKWKEQRDILMRFVSDISDVELAQGNPEFADLLPELEKAPSTDDIQKKFSKALSEWKKKQEEIPVRIDELSKSLADIDVAEQELAKSDLERQIAEVDKKIEDAGSAVGDLLSEEMQLQMDLSGVMQTMNQELSNQRVELQNSKDTAMKQFNEAHNGILEAEKQIAKNNELLAAEEAKKPDINRQWKENKESVFDEKPYLFDESQWKFDETSKVCSLCGQALPADKVERLISDFESRKADAKTKAKEMLETAKKAFISAKEEKRKKIHAMVAEIKQNIDNFTAQNAELQTEIEELKKQEQEALAKQNEFVKQLSELPEQADYMKNAEYLVLWEKLEGVRKHIASMKSSTDAVETFKTEKAELQEQLDAVKAEIAKASKNVEIEERIGELETEQREVGQKVADQEKMLYLLEQFIKAKMLKISESINSKFMTVSWRLFELQINGGLKETCECTVSGVPFSTLNSGHRIVAGLDIINSLSELYGVSAPIFIDNAESVNKFNLPDIDTQLILLSVTEDKELRVEGV